MKIRLVRAWCAAALLFFAGKAVNAQDYHKLIPDDFKGAPRRGIENAIAYTDCYIGFTYVPHYVRNYYILDFTVELKLNSDKSWLDRSRITSPEMMTEILKHEQGHYMIAYMEQQEILRTVSKMVFHEDYMEAAKNIFRRINDKYQQLNLDYDADTNHSLNREQQHSWDAYFKKRMEFMPPEKG